MALAIRAKSQSLWDRAVASLPDDVRSQIDFNQDDKQLPLGDLLKMTEDAQKKAAENSWNFTRKNGEKVILREVFAKVSKLLNKSMAVGSTIVQYDPIAMADITTHSAMLDYLASVAEFISRNAPLERIVTELGDSEDLSGYLVRLYAAVLEFLGKARQFFRMKTAARVAKYGLGHSGSLDKSFRSIEDTQREVYSAVARVTLSGQLHIVGEINSLLDMFREAHTHWSDSLEGIKDHLDQGTRSKILNYISTEPYKNHHKQARDGVLKGTGQWLLGDAEYIHWKNDHASSILWLHGIPGSGKSKLVSIVVDDALTAFRKRRASKPVYFYCSRNPAEPGRSDAASIIACLARQLAMPQRTDLLDPAVRLYDDEEEGFSQGSLTLGQGQSLIFEMLDYYKDTVVLMFLDALDECSRGTRMELLVTLEALLKESPCLIKIFVSSRDDQDIVCRLQSYPTLELSSERNSADINNYVSSTVDARIAYGQLLLGSARQGDLRDKIVDELTRQARGMFRWASLQIDMLCRLKSDEAVQRRLGKLPKELNDLYAEVLQQIDEYEDPADQELAHSALSWLLCTHSTLTSEDLLRAIRYSKGELFSSIQKEQLLHLCCNLILWDVGLDTFRFAHLSVREFLEQCHHYTIQTTNALVAEACLFAVSKCSVLENWLNDSLAWYCDVYWAFHAAATDLDEFTGLKRLVQDLFEDVTEGSPAMRWARSVGNAVARLETSEILAPQRLKSATSLNSLKLGVACAFDLDCILSKETWEAGGLDVWEPFVATKEDMVLSYGSSKVFSWCLDNDVIVFERTGNISYNVWDYARMNGRMLELLFKKRGKNIQITEAVVRAALRSKDLIELLFEKTGDQVPITDDLVLMAANQTDGDVIEFLLKKRQHHVQVTEDLLVAAARNWSCAKDSLEVLLQRREKMEQIPQAVIIAAAENRYCGKDIVGFLIKKWGPQVRITDDVVLAAARNTHHGAPILELLLEERGDEVHTTTAILEAAARNDRLSGDIMGSLLKKREGNVLITEHLVEAAATSQRNGVEKIQLLLEENGAEIPVTERIVKAAVTLRGTGIIESIFERMEEQVPITEAVVVAAVGGSCAADMIEFLLKKKGEEFPITEAVMEAAAGSDSCARRIMCFFKEKGHNIPITETMIEAAAKSSSADNFKVLLEWRGVEVPVTEAVTKAAAGNPYHPEKMEFLLEWKGEEVPITEAVIEAAAGHTGGGAAKVRDLLLEKRNKRALETLQQEDTGNQEGQKVDAMAMDLSD